MSAGFQKLRERRADLLNKSIWIVFRTVFSSGINTGRDLIIQSIADGCAIAGTGVINGVRAEALESVSEDP